MEFTKNACDLASVFGAYTRYIAANSQNTASRLSAHYFRY